MMRNLKSLALVLCIGLSLLMPSARADEHDKLTKISFSGPVQVGKTQLPAGTYTFKLMDLGGDRNVVQIFNEDETHLIATVLANPDYRLEPTSDTTVKFAETSNGSETSGNVPETGVPIKEWFYPGDSWGQEFPVKAVQVAAAEPEPAPEAAPEPAPTAAPQPEAPQAATPTPEAAAPAAAEAADPVTPAPPPQTEQTAPATEQQATPAELPQTASRLPLIAPIGVLSLAAAGSLRILLKVTA
jgi:hypothetical protein